MTTSCDLAHIRASEATLTLLDRAGQPIAGRQVTVEQTRHAFGFGITGAGAVPFLNGELSGEKQEQGQTHADKLLDLFNFVTLPFYWGRFEPEQGKPDTKRILTAAKWFKSHGCTIKGHPLCWHSVCCDWLMQYPNDKIIDLQRQRIEREVADFAGVIDMWDVINEAVIMPVFDKYDNAMTRVCWQIGRVAMIRNVFDAARQTNPSATLLLNDFDMSTAFECLIEAVLEAGIKIDVLGLQSHMHQGYWGEEKTRDVLRRFSRYGIPIHFTESTLVSGEIMPAHIVDLNDHQVDHWPSTPEQEQRQAEELVRHYTTLMSHPSVEAITWWGLNDGGWLKAPSGLLHADQSTKPAYEALHKLVKGEWWMKPTEMVTDVQGRVNVNGFFGDYRVSCNGECADFQIQKDAANEMDLRL